MEKEKEKRKICTWNDKSILKKKNLINNNNNTVIILHWDATGFFPKFFFNMGENIIDVEPNKYFALLSSLLSA